MSPRTVVPGLATTFSLLTTAILNWFNQRHGSHRKRFFHYCLFSRLWGNVSTELFPSNGCCTVACVHSCYLPMGLQVTLYNSVCIYSTELSSPLSLPSADSQKAAHPPRWARVCCVHKDKCKNDTLFVANLVNIASQNKTPNRPPELELCTYVCVSTVLFLFYFVLDLFSCFFC
jgi:hypothetical protein